MSPLQPDTVRSPLVLGDLLALALLTLPWLVPFAPGPSAAVVPLLAAWTCVGVLALIGPGAEGRDAGGAAWRAGHLPIPGLLPGRAWAWAIGLAVLWVVAALRPVGLPGMEVEVAGAAVDGSMPVLNVSAETLGLMFSLLAVGVCAAVFARASARGVRMLALAWVVAALAGVAIGWLQYTGHAGAFWPWVNGAPPGVAFGNLRQRNLYASGLAIGLAALLWWARGAPPARRQALVREVVLGAAALALGSGLALSASRTGLVALLLLCGLAGVWRLWRERAVAAVLAAAVLGYAATAMLLPWAFPQWAAGGIFSRLADGAPACSSRVTLWSNVLHLIALRPLGGWGWGQLDAAHYLTLYPGLRFCDILDNAHNLPLHLAVELGVPFALLFCGVVLWGLWRARPWRERDTSRQLAWGVLAVIGLHSLLEYPLWYGPFQMAAGASLGLLLGTPPAHGAAAHARHGGGGAWGFFRLGGALTLLAGCAYAAYDYGRVSQIYLEPAARNTLFGADALQAAEHTTVFGDAADFALLTLTPVTEANAAAVWTLALRLLRYSPEPRVAGALIDSAVLLGRDDLALWHQQRYEAAFGKR